MKLYNMPLVTRPNPAFEALSKICAREDSRYAISSIAADGDCAVATDGRTLVALKADESFFKNTAVREDDLTFPPWRDVLANPEKAIVVALDPQLLSRAMLAVHGETVLLVIPHEYGKPLGLCNYSGTAIGAVMPRDGGSQDAMMTKYKDTLAQFKKKPVKK